MHIGLIGGIGPAATIAYYKKILETFNAADTVLEMTIVHADISALAANAATGRADAQADIFATHLSQLYRAGCDIGVITALTGHFCIAQTSRLSAIPVLSATDLIDSYCTRNDIRALGLLGGPSVLDTHLFGLLKSTKTIVPALDRGVLGTDYMQMAMEGHCNTQTAERFIAAGQAMVSDQGADAILLAGTDLGLVFDNQPVGYRVISALDIHVDGLLDLASKDPA